MKREYKNDFEYKQLFPETGEKIKSPPVYTLGLNDHHFYNYFEFKQTDIVMSKRVWLDVSNNDESSFFGNDDFYHMLIDSIVKKKITVYVPNNDEAISKISLSAIQTIADTAGKEIIGFKLKEDWFFDNKRKTAEKRIIAVCPIVCKKDTSRTTDDDYSFEMGWISFPSLRNTLGAIDNTNPNCPTMIKTLDDLFFFRYFVGEITKETNVKNQSLNDYCS